MRWPRAGLRLRPFLCSIYLKDSRSDKPTPPLFLGIYLVCWGCGVGGLTAFWAVPPAGGGGPEESRAPSKATAGAWANHVIHSLTLLPASVVERVSSARLLAWWRVHSTARLQKRNRSAQDDRVWVGLGRTGESRFARCARNGRKEKQGQRQKRIPALRCGMTTRERQARRV
jgi:hypothetical protein